MSETSGVTRKKGSTWSFLFWWRTDPEEIERQVAGYRSLRVWQSARGISLLCCLFTVAVTLALGGLVGIPMTDALVDGTIWTALGLLMYRGQRWAFIAGMVLWTFEKGYFVVTQVGTVHAQPPMQIVLQFIWWAVYLHVFMLGLRVESLRRKALTETQRASTEEPLA